MSAEDSGEVDTVITVLSDQVEQSAADVANGDVTFAADLDELFAQLDQDNS